jgi:hypothetical protein
MGTLPEFQALFRAGALKAAPGGLRKQNRQDHSAALCDKWQRREA